MVKKKKKSKQKKAFRDLFEILNDFLNKRGKTILWIGIATTLLFGALLFDMKISTGGDDSSYIVRAHRFIHKGQFPSFQAPLYPIILSLPIAIFGVHLPMLKLISLAFVAGHLIFFYKAFKKRSPGLVLYPVLLLVSLNAYILYHGSQTYSEAMFMFVQAVFFYFFFRYFLNTDSQLDIKKDFKKIIVFALILMTMGLTRKIGFGAFIGTAIFFVFHKQWKNLINVSGVFIALMGIYTGLKKLIWGSGSFEMGTQENRLLLKDPYDPSKGTEDISGFIERFFDNSMLYISKHLYIFMGFKPDQAQTSTFLAIFTYAIFIMALVLVWRKNKALLFSGIYLAVMLGGTFITIQARWDQGRLVLVYLPLIMLFLLSGFYYLFQKKTLKSFQFAFVLLLIIMFVPTFSNTTDKVQNKLPDLKKNMRGDIYHGYTPDWVNYLKMCEWAAKNVPEDVKIAARKPSMAFIFSGNSREFHGIYRIKTEDPDELLNKLREKNVHYVIAANLRRIPDRKTEHTINTVRRYLYYIQQKYPRAFQKVHQVGQSEPAELYKINYDNISQGSK